MFAMRTARTSPFLSFSLCMFLSFVGISTANAGVMTIAPLRLDFTAKKSSDSVMVRNDGAEEITIEASAVSWSDDNSQDRYAPTRDILLAPAIFKMAPGAMQIVRFASRIAPSEKEQAYRIFFSELPRASTPAKTNQINTTLTITIPVFIKPLSEQKTSMQWTAMTLKKQGAQSVLRISGANTGGMHERVTSLSLVSSPGNLSIPLNQPTKYVLPDRARYWDIPLTADQEKQLEKIIYTYHDADDRIVTGRLSIKD